MTGAVADGDALHAGLQLTPLKPPGKGFLFTQRESNTKGKSAFPTPTARLLKQAQGSRKSAAAEIQENG